MPNSQPSPYMRTLGTKLPTSETVHRRVYGPAPRGRPLAIPPKNLALKKDKGQPVGYRLLWQKIKPEVLQRAEDLQGTHMPPSLMPQALRTYNTKKHRREH